MLRVILVLNTEIANVKGNKYVDEPTRWANSYK